MQDAAGAMNADGEHNDLVFFASETEAKEWGCLWLEVNAASALSWMIGLSKIIYENETEIWKRQAIIELMQFYSVFKLNFFRLSSLLIRDGLKRLYLIYIVTYLCTVIVSSKVTKVTFLKYW
jgi:hypothetical protein